MWTSAKQDIVNVRYLFGSTFCIICTWTRISPEDCCVTELYSIFYIHGSMHHNSILIRSNKMQQHAGIYLLHNHSACFRCPSHPSTGVHKTVTATSGTGHSIWATTFLQRGLWPRWRKVVVMLLLWPVPEAAVTVLCTPVDGCNGHPKHAEWLCSK